MEFPTFRPPTTADRTSSGTCGSKGPPGRNRGLVVPDNSPRSSRLRSLRARMLAIGLVPSLLLLMGGLGLGLYLVATARHEQQRSAALSAVAERTVDLVSTLREERRTSERLAVPGAPAQLDQVRRQVDDTANALLEAGESIPSDPSGPGRGDGRAAHRGRIAQRGAPPGGRRTGGRAERRAVLRPPAGRRHRTARRDRPRVEQRGGHREAEQRGVPGPVGRPAGPVDVRRRCRGRRRGTAGRRADVLPRTERGLRRRAGRGREHLAPAGPGRARDVRDAPRFRRGRDARRGPHGPRGAAGRRCRARCSTSRRRWPRTTVPQRSSSTACTGSVRRSSRQGDAEDQEQAADQVRTAVAARDAPARAGRVSSWPLP